MEGFENALWGRGVWETAVRQLFLEPLLVSFLFSSSQKPGFQVRPMRSGGT